jgi:hypothetical protein
MVNPPAAAFPGCWPALEAAGCLEAGVLFKRLQTISIRLERRVCTKIQILFWKDVIPASNSVSFLEKKGWR